MYLFRRYHHKIVRMYFISNSQENYLRETFEFKIQRNREDRLMDYTVYKLIKLK